MTLYLSYILNRHFPWSVEIQLNIHVLSSYVSTIPRELQVIGIAIFTRSSVYVKNAIIKYLWVGYIRNYDVVIEVHYHFTYVWYWVDFSPKILIQRIHHVESIFFSLSSICWQIITNNNSLESIIRGTRIWRGISSCSSFYSHWKWILIWKWGRVIIS